MLLKVSLFIYLFSETILLEEEELARSPPEPDSMQPPVKDVGSATSTDRAGVSCFALSAVVWVELKVITDYFLEGRVWTCFQSLCGSHVGIPEH